MRIAGSRQPPGQRDVASNTYDTADQLLLWRTSRLRDNVFELQLRIEPSRNRTQVLEADGDVVTSIDPTYQLTNEAEGANSYNISYVMTRWATGRCS